jgi:hypothetical protein
MCMRGNSILSNIPRNSKLWNYRILFHESQTPEGYSITPYYFQHNSKQLRGSSIRRIARSKFFHLHHVKSRQM